MWKVVGYCRISSSSLQAELIEERLEALCEEVSTEIAQAVMSNWWIGVGSKAC
jgi:hypothetical protein